MLWKDVVGFEGCYTISEFGDIRSNYKNKKILKPKRDKDGYLGVSLSKNGKAHHLRVHRLVAQAFLDNPHNLPIVNHKDLCVTNNHYSNLEWCNNFHNVVHYFRESGVSKGVSSLEVGRILEIPVLYEKGHSYSEICSILGLECRPDAISEVLSGRRFSEITGITEDNRDPSRRHPVVIDDDCVLFCLEEYHINNVPQKDLCSRFKLSAAQMSRILNGTRRVDLYNVFMKELYDKS